MALLSLVIIWVPSLTLVSSFFPSDGSNTILSNIEWTRKTFFEHLRNSNVFIYWWSNLNTWILASNKQTSNINIWSLRKLGTIKFTLFFPDFKKGLLLILLLACFISSLFSTELLPLWAFYLDEESTSSWHMDKSWKWSTPCVD